MQDSEIQDENQNICLPTVTLKRILLWLTPFLAFYMTELFLLDHVLPDKYEEYLRTKARTSPDLSKPRLNFIRIPYDNQTHTVSPFLMKSLSDILGAICSNFLLFLF
jgi:hypothetical protein